MGARRVVAIVGGVVGVLGVAYGLSRIQDDPVINLDAIRTTGVRVSETAVRPTEQLGASSVPDATTPVPVIARTESVDGLEQLVGVIRQGDGVDSWYVNGVELDVGPEGWLLAAPALGDYDTDGTDERFLDELLGLDGREAVFGVQYELDDEDRDDADVFTINGLTYRDPAGGAAPWQGADPRPVATPAQIEAAAAGAIGPGARVTDVDRELDDSWPGWDVEVVGPDGTDYQVLLDLAGEVLDVRLDD